MTAMLGSKVSFGATGVSEAAAQAEGGKIRVLAVTSAEPVKGVDAKTLKQQGVDLEFSNWRGIVAPPGLSDAKKQQFIKLVTDAHASEQWKQTLTKQGWTDAFITGDEFKTFLTEENDRVSGVLKELGLA